MATAFSSDTLPSRFDHSEAQPRIYRQWEEAGFFHAEIDSSRKPYTIVIPPPNVTGALHLGHALNNTLQDVMIRMKRMQGFVALWMPGTDHAGIATQAVVERRLREEEGKTRHDLGREKLVQRIWEWKAEYEQRILGQLKSIGCSCDWQRLRFTLDDVCARAVRHTFFDLFRQDLIYRGKRLVNWDTFLQTAVSDDEVFHETVQGHFWHFQYPVIDPRPGEPRFVTIATTRPETMLGDTAVAVHPDPGAALERVAAELSERLSTAPSKEREGLERQLDDVQSRRTDLLPALVQLRDMAADGRQLLLPLLDRPIPLVTDPWAKPELGSGCVKITPAHDPNDYEVGQRCGLPMVNILNPDGTLNGNAGPYAGLPIAAARKRVVTDLDARQLLGNVEDREIDLAHSDRSKTPIEPYMADQWFVRMDSLAQSAMDAVSDGRVKIFPERYAKGYHDWLSEKRDWPVSRQLWWGHQIPIWSRPFAHQRAADEWATAHLQSDEASTAGLLAWHVEACDKESAETESAVVLHACVRDEGANAEQRLESLGMTREQDVLDTWFSSALWPHSTLGWPEPSAELDYFYPTSTLITSRDIITLWVARMVLTGLNNMQDVPFSEVFIHPKILDGYGETMSKSKGNGVDPIDVIEKFGADSLRFGLAHLTTETQDVRMPVQFECPGCQELMDQTKANREQPVVTCEKCNQPFSTQWARSEDDIQLPRGRVVSERFEVSRNFCNKLWNAARFVLINMEGYVPAPVADHELAFEDRWLLSRLASVTTEVTDSLESYRFADAMRALYEFAWDEFCSFYVEMAKDRLQDDARRPVAQRVVAHALDVLLRLLHPAIPFITEEIWHLLGKAAPARGLTDVGQPAASVMMAPWPTAQANARDEQIEAQFSRFQAALAAIREIRSRQNIPPRETIEFQIRCEPVVEQLLKPMSEYFASMARATAIAWGTDMTPPPTNASARLPDMEIFVDLKNFIDVEAERDRLIKQIERIENLIAGKQKKLSNENFVGRAPADVVQRERDSLVELEQQLAAARKSLDALPQ